jgi:hypothetical protein
MRNVRILTAAEWDRGYPTFAKAVRNSAFAPSGNAWDSEISAMNTELALRTAAFLLEAPSLSYE